LTCKNNAVGSSFRCLIGWLFRTASHDRARFRVDQRSVFTLD